MISVLETHLFGLGGTGTAFLRNGWARPEPGFVWSLGHESTLVLPSVPAGDGIRLELTLAPFISPPALSHQHGRCTVDGRETISGRVGGRVTWGMTLPKRTADGAVEVTLHREPRGPGAARLLPGESRDLGFKLIELKIVRAPRLELPAAKRPLSEWRFGWNAETEGCLQDGWGAPEDGYVWALGRTSRLRLPLDRKQRQRPGLLLLDMRPFWNGIDPARQRIAVGADGRLLRYLDLRKRAVVAIPVEPDASADGITVHFDHLDAASQPQTPVHATGLPFAWALASARLVPQLPAARPHMLPPLVFEHTPSSPDDPVVASAVRARTGRTLPDVVSCFESLGSGCGLGTLQRRLGKLPIGLLIYAALHQHQLVEGLLAGFADLGRRDRLYWGVRSEVDTTWRMIDQIFGMSMSTPYPRSLPQPERGLVQASTSLPWLASKLMADMATAGKIFTIRFDGIPDEAAALAVLAAMRRFGNSCLLWLVEDGTGAPGSVERLASGLFRGHLNPEPPPPDVDANDMVLISILANTVALIGAP